MNNELSWIGASLRRINGDWLVAIKIFDEEAEAGVFSTLEGALGYIKFNVQSRSEKFGAATDRLYADLMNCPLEAASGVICKN